MSSEVWIEPEILNPVMVTLGHVINRRCQGVILTAVTLLFPSPRECLVMLIRRCSRCDGNYDFHLPGHLQRTRISPHPLRAHS